MSIDCDISAVVVIGGGQSIEHDVSLASAAAVASVLSEAAEYEVTSLTIARDGLWHRDSTPLGEGVGASLATAVELISHVDVVFPAVHGPDGEDGTLAALSRLADVPMVGSGVGASAFGMNKWVTKLVAEHIGIPTAPAYVVDPSRRLPEIDRDVVVKPVSSGSSNGVSVVRSAAELAAAVAAAGSLDDRILIEPVITGREIDVAVIREADGTVWSPPPLEILGGGIFTTEAKYDGSAEFSIPADLTDTELLTLTSTARAVYEALGCRGVARIDFFLTTEGPVLNEVNTMPGLTTQSQVPRMFAAADVGYRDLVERLLTAAVVDHRG